MNTFKIKCLGVLFIFIQYTLTNEYKFHRTIEAVGLPYYKIMLSLGSCKGRKIFTENRIWRSVKMNRVFDIYYETGNSQITVSRVEIKLVINNTDCYAYSERGVGSTTFFATTFLPIFSGTVIYHLDIYTCANPIAESTPAILREKSEEYDEDPDIDQTSSDDTETANEDDQADADTL